MPRYKRYWDNEVQDKCIYIYFGIEQKKMKIGRQLHWFIYPKSKFD